MACFEDFEAIVVAVWVRLWYGGFSVRTPDNCVCFVQGRPSAFRSRWLGNGYWGTGNSRMVRVRSSKVWGGVIDCLLLTPDNRRLLEFIGENRLFEEGRGLGS